MSFFRDFFSGFVARDILRDAQHAHKTFTSNNYELAPRNKFLFHVYFTLNTEIPGLRSVFGQDEQATIGLMVKTIELPKYSVDTETYNQYNRKRIVQKQIEYDPVEMTFHDDSSDLVRKLWYNYFSYYYLDPSQSYGSAGSASADAGFAYSERDIYTPERKANDWGYFGEGFGAGGQLVSKPAFFRDITIYGFNQHRWASYVLINPLITQWSHDRYDYSQGDGTMENRVSVEYETVKYFSGLIGEDGNATTVPGFGNPTHYDKTLSPNARSGGNATVFGEGGLLDSGLGVVDDLANGNILGAIQRAGRARETFRDADIGDLAAQEATAAAVSVATGIAVGAVATANDRVREAVSSRNASTSQNSSESINLPLAGRDATPRAVASPGAREPATVVTAGATISEEIVGEDLPPIPVTAPAEDILPATFDGTPLEPVSENPTDGTTNETQTGTGIDVPESGTTLGTGGA